jgi:membrane associated rhomboid family serine protease
MSYRSYRGDNIAPVLAIIILCFLVFIAISIADLLGHNITSPLELQTASFLAKPWTIVTNLFVHADIWHLVFNMLTFYFFGTFLLRLVGIRTFLIIYFFGGIMGNIFFMISAYFWFLASPFSIVIGASGAVFALGGALAVLTPRLRVFVFPIPAPMPLWVAVIGGFVILTIAARFAPIAWQAHLGGLVLGLLAGFALRNRVRTPIS